MLPLELSLLQHLTIEKNDEVFLILFICQQLIIMVTDGVSDTKFVAQFWANSI